VAGKIEKSDGPLKLTLVRTPDILAGLGRARGNRSRPVLVGFAAESGNPAARGREKLESKRVDLIVANDISSPGAGFDADTNAAILISAGADEPFPLALKSELAATILDPDGRARILAGQPYTMDNSQVAEHLRFFQELGVDGVSRDPAWRQRVAAPASPDLAPAARAIPLAAIREPLAVIREDLGDCTRCKLHGMGRRQIVFGVGNPNAELMFVGEAPGADEDAQGVPFVGRAGQLLTKMIQAMGYQRDDVYIANVLKCRPPGNRDPQPDEVESCEPFLFRQIASVQPKVIIALGAFAARTLLETIDPISRLRGRVFEFRGAKLIPTFHPSFLLRSPGYKREAWEDLKTALAILGRPVSPASSD
jgi:DNA polymerase